MINTFIKKKIGILIFSGMLCLSACAKNQAETEETVLETVQMPVDIIQKVEQSVHSQTDSLDNPELSKQYQIILDGYTDRNAGYYLQDLTGDGQPELIVGADIMTVYSFQNGSILTLGELPMQEAYLSQKLGLLAICKNNDAFELRQYLYNGEQFSEYLLEKASVELSIKNMLKTEYGDVEALFWYECANRAPFE